MPELPKALIHIGRPDAELPHKSFRRVEALFKKYPDVYFVCILWKKEDCEEVGKEIAKLERPKEHPGFEIVHWDNDVSLMDYLCAQLHKFIGAKIVSPGWYNCPNQHTSDRTMDKPLEKCPTCNDPVIYKTEFDEQFQKFAMIFAKVASLINFDTRSGEALNTVVNPTANVMLNMPYAMPIDDAAARNVDMDTLVGTGKGKRAYLVAAGPSLEDALPDLKRLQDTGIIVCVGRVYKLLRENGIRVDYTVSCEMFDWDSVIFDGLTDVGETILCYPIVCAPATIKKWPGRRTCLWDVNSAEMLKRKKWMMGGNSVAHHVLNFAAEILECDEVIFIGQDLAYTKPRAHAKGTDHEFPDGVKQGDQAYHTEERWYPSNGKGAFSDDCFRIEADPRKAAPIGPVYVRTSQSYLEFLSLFEILLNRHKKKAWNASANGVKIAGAPYLNLATYLVERAVS
jgi:hypothetical protein